MGGTSLKPLSHYGPITATKFILNLVLIANGPVLKIYDTQLSRIVFNEKLFGSNKIHNISFLGDNIVLSGGRSFLATKLSLLLSHKSGDPTSSKFLEKAMKDWISACEFVSPTHLLILTAHNSVYSLKTSDDFSKLSIDATYICGEVSILYSGSIRVISKEKIYVAAGTVMSGVLIWDLYSGNILHNLLGHEGSIFNVKIDDAGERIVTCSDDRSIKLWDMITGKNLSTGWGHTSRIWNLEFFEENYIMSCSEDCTSRIWEYIPGQDLKMMEVWDAHLGKNVWSGDVSKELGLVVSGGADGRVRLHDLHPVVLNKSQTESFSVKEITNQTGISFEKNEIIKQFMEISSGLVILTSQGKIFLFQNFTKWAFILEDLKFSNFGYCDGFHEEDIALLASRNGDLLLLKFEDGNLMLKKEVLESHLNDNNITNIITHRKDSKLYVLSDSPNPKLPFLLREIDSSDLSVIRTTQLSKPNQSFISTCLEIDAVNNWVFIGSRFVSICLYDLSNSQSSGATSQCQLTNIYKKLSAGDTITGINTILSSAGAVSSVVTVRDGMYLYIDISSDYKLKVTHKNKLTKGFLEGSFLNLNGDLMLYGFKSSFFYLWNESKQIEVMNELCGGSHRQWDFRYSFKNDRLSAQFQYIKNSDFYYKKFKCRFDHKTYGAIDNGTHGREIRDVTIAPSNYSNGSKLIMTASEDATIKLSKLSDNGSVDNFWAIRSHTSGLQKIKFISSKYVISSAAREEFLIWEISESNNPKYPLIAEIGNLKPSSDNPDLRIMDFDTLEVHDSSNQLIGFIIINCYSNSELKLWYFDISSKSFRLLVQDRYTTCCLLNVKFVLTSDSQIYVLTGATDGHLSVWNITSKVTPNFELDSTSSYLVLSGESLDLEVGELDILVIKQQIHQSGIKAFHIDYKKGNEIVIVTGGDDNSLIKSTLTVGDKTLHYKLISLVEAAASSTITSISPLSEDRILVTSVDQILRVWDYKKGLLLSASRYTTIADTGCSASTTFETDKGTKEIALVGGAGLSSWTIC